MTCRLELGSWNYGATFSVTECRLALEQATYACGRGRHLPALSLTGSESFIGSESFTGSESITGSESSTY